MKALRKFRFYERLLKFTYLANGFFIAVGIAAVFTYIRNQNVDSLILIFVGVGTIVFGVIIPWRVVLKIRELKKEFQKQTEEVVARLISGAIETYKESHGDVLSDPLFWINITVLITEVFDKYITNPAVRSVVDFIPLIKQELKKKRAKKKRPSE